MSLTISFSSTSAERARTDLLVVPVFAERELGPGAAAVDRALARGGGTLDAFMQEVDFSGKVGETLAVPTGGRLGATAALLVGLGARDAIDADALRRAGALVARKATKVARVATTLLDAAPEGLERAVAAQALAEGLALGRYQFLRYRREAKASQLASVTLLGRSDARSRDAVARGLTAARAVAWARDLVNEPSAHKSPAEFCAAAQSALRGTGVRVQVWQGAELERRRLHGTITVGKGSQRPPRFLRLEYAPAGATRTIALVGKGVVFDSGGLSLKTTSGMENMKTDMAGGAAVVATMSVLRELGVGVRVLGFVPLVENMPSGTAYRLGDVITYRNRKTVEVMNTDAEGRLILADALCLASEAKPDAVIDLATLTGACMVALGEKIAGLMGNDEAWIDQIRSAAARAGESVWPLPLPKEYRKLLDSEIADMKNVGGSYGGAITAGLFLQEFVKDVPWAHLDIAGPSRANADDGPMTRGGTGFGVLTLIELVRGFEAPRRARGRTRK